MMDLFELCVNIAEEFITIMFLSLYFGYKYTGIKRYFGFVLTLVISVCTISFFNSLYIYEGILGITFIAIYVGYTAIFLKGDIYTKIFVSGFINSIVYFIALFVTLCFHAVSGQESDVLYKIGAARIISILLSKLLLIGACAVLLKFKPDYVAKKSNMIVLIILPIVTEISIVGIMNIFLKSKELGVEIFLVTASIMCLNILTYYVFIQINKEIAVKTEMKILQQKYEHDKKHIQEVTELYSKVCSIRHDALNHFSILNGLIDKDNKEAKEYIKSIVNNSIKEVKCTVKMDNIVLETIINAKLAICDDYDIKTYISIMNGAFDFMFQDEIGVLFGNLFDNAIEASKNSEKKSIELQGWKDGKHTLLLIKNSIDETVLGKNKTLMTTKSDKNNHGYGIKSINRIVNNYNGYIEHYEKNGYFISYIYMQREKNTVRP